MGHLGGELCEQSPSFRLRQVRFRGSRVEPGVFEEVHSKTLQFRISIFLLSNGVRPVLLSQQQKVQDEKRVQDDAGFAALLLAQKRLQNVRRSAALHHGGGGEEVRQRWQVAPPRIRPRPRDGVLWAATFGRKNGRH